MLIVLQTVFQRTQIMLSICIYYRSCVADLNFAVVLNECHIQLSNQDAIVSTMCASQWVPIDQHVASFYHCRLPGKARLTRHKIPTKTPLGNVVFLQIIPHLDFAVNFLRIYRVLRFLVETHNHLVLVW